MQSRPYPSRGVRPANFVISRRPLLNLQPHRPKRLPPLEIS
jgi:hypothetical protein